MSNPGPADHRIRSAPVPRDQCGMALACDLLGDRWTMLIIREAFYGVTRFDDLRSDLGIPRGVLSSRLRGLVDRGVLETRPYREQGAIVIQVPARLSNSKVSAVIPEMVEKILTREAREKISDSELGEVFWQTSGRWDWADGIHYQTYTDTIYLLRVNDFVLDDAHWTPEEHRDILEARWWKVSELIASGERVGPHGLAEHLGLHLAS